MANFTQVSNAVFDDPRLGKHEILVYITLKRHTDNDTGYCYPSIRIIAKGARLSGATVLGAIDVLVRTGWLRVQKRNEPGRKEHAVNTYLVLEGCSPDEHVYHGANTGVRPVDKRCSPGRTELDSRTRKNADPQSAGNPAGPPTGSGSEPKRDSLGIVPTGELPVFLDPEDDLDEAGRSVRVGKLMAEFRDQLKAAG